MIRSTTAAFAIVLLPAASHAAWEESADGDLSNLSTAPTPLVFAEGLNTITGRMGVDVNGALDPDFFTFTLTAGQQLTAMELVAFMADDFPGSGSFIAIAAGSTISTDDADTHLSNGLFNAPVDLLTAMSTPVYGGAGLPGPLPAGMYTFWIQETTTQADYALAFTVTPIPEPATASLGLLAVAGLARQRFGREGHSY